jgi:hypothetical protein
MSSSPSSDLALQPPAEPKALAIAAKAIEAIVVVVLAVGLALAASLYAGASSSSLAGGRERRRKIRGWRKASSRTATTDDARASTVLGLPPDAAPSQIRKRYHQLARDHHPDKHPDNRQWAHQQLVGYNTAYQALVDSRPAVAGVTDGRTPTPPPWPEPWPPVSGLLLEPLVYTAMAIVVAEFCVMLVPAVVGGVRNAFRRVRLWWRWRWYYRWWWQMT